MEESKSEAEVSRKTFFPRDPLTTTLSLVGIFLASQILAGVLTSLYPSLRNWTAQQSSAWLENSVIAQFVYILLAEGIAVWMIFKILKRARIARRRIGLMMPTLKDVTRSLAGYGVYFLSYIVILLVAGHFTNLNVDQPQDIGFESAGGSSLILVFLSLAVLPPLAEEIMFRGFLFSSLRAKFRFRYAVVATSILFGIAHLQFGSGAPLLWVAAIDTFVLSAVLCYLREKTGSLWSSIFLHTIKNSVAFIALFHSRF